MFNSQGALKGEKSMNRRIVVPASVLGLALCFALISLPARPTNARDASQATQEATVDPCNPKPQIPGIITADSLFVFTEPLNTSPQLLIIKRADVVDVFGRNANGIWVLVETNSGISGWIPSRFVTM